MCETGRGTGQRAGERKRTQTGNSKAEKRTTGWPWPPLSNANGNIYILYCVRDKSRGCLVSEDWARRVLVLALATWLANLTLQ